MNANRVLSVLLAVVCVAAGGVAATTLESSLETDPDDVIDVNVRQLPIGGDAVVAMKREMQSNRRSGGDATRPRPSASDEVAQVREQLREERPASLARSMANRGASPSERFPWLWVALAAALAALGYRYRDRLLARLPSRSDPDGGARRWPPGEPSNEVERAWLEVVRRADPDRPRSKTVAECKRIAIDRGLDPEAVRPVARAFREVRYGEASLTDARRRLVRRCRRRLGRGPEGGG